MDRRPFSQWMTRHVPIFLIACISLSALVLAQGKDRGRAQPATTLQDGTCHPKDTCKLDKASRISDPPDWEKRNCLCDDLCVQYGDCCLDSPRYSPDQWRKAEQRFTCVEFRQYKSNWIVNTCPAGWTDEETRSLCEVFPEIGKQYRDPFAQLPVTSINNRVTYRNIHCARCNGETPSFAADGSARLRFWNPRLECPSLLSNNIRNFDNKLLRWDEEQELWGLTINLGNGEMFYPCQIDPALPDDLVPLIRPCQKSITRCAADWNDAAVEAKCRSYTSFVYRREEAQIYHNMDCAHCNYVNRSELLCNNTAATYRELKPRDFDLNAFAVLFDLKDSEGGELVGQQRKCPNDQLFDPISLKCREVFCSTPKVYRDGRCLDPTTTSTTTSSTTSTTPSTTTSVTTPSSPTTAPTDAIVVTDDAVIFPDDVTVTTPKFGEPTIPSVTTPTVTRPTSAAPTTQSTPATTDPAQQDVPSESEFASCVKFRLSPQEVEWRENGTLYVKDYGTEYNSTEYEKLNDGNVLICANGVTTVAKFDPVLGWVTVAGLGLSELCLALHLLAFVLSPDLRNLSGRNLASLSLALFAAYGSFIVAQFVPTNTCVCLGISISTFYFFLVAFWWTSVLAWDVWRTIRMATVQLRSTSGKQWGKFALYSLYAWIVPALIVAATLVIEYVDLPFLSWIPDAYHPHFGRQVCWFGQRKAILVYFAAPLSLILFVNLILFINSAYMIRSTTAKSPTSCNPAGSRKQLGLYVRLALIMGLSWIAGLVAGAADLQPLWYVFVVLCTMQGVFILFAYTCNPKVARSIRNRFLFCSTKTRHATYRTALVGGVKSEHLRRLGLEARDSHDSQSSNTSQASQSSQASLTKTTGTSTTSP